MIAPDEFPNRAFQLAYFLHRERKIAAEIAGRALNKLQLAETAQGKRLYYRLTGRTDTRKARSRVSMGEPHLLQRLVYVESEEFERRKEAAALSSQAHDGVTPARRSDLVVYFIKHIVRITLRRNSFYVTLGLSRLVYNYSTPETMELYNLIVQDPDRVPDDYYYRSRKGVLLKELKERFGELVEISKGVRGEQRWRAGEAGEQDHELVTRCLNWFTPWSTPCVVPEQFDPLNDQIEQLNFAGRQPDEEHEVEVNRIHAAIHPQCFARLTSVNRFPRPDERLELPHFLLGDGGENDLDDDSRTPPSLSNEELQVINNLLAQEAKRRKNVSAGFLQVRVDGIEQAQINVAHATNTQFQVDDAAELVEVYTSDQQGSLLLATHLLNLSGPGNQSFTINTEGGQQIAFSITVHHDEHGLANGAEVSVAFKENTTVFNAIQRAWTLARGEQSRGWLKPIAALALIALIAAGAWWVLTNQQPKEIVRVDPTPAPTPVISASPNQTPAPTPAKVRQEPKVEELVARNLITNPITNTESDEVATRGTWNRDSMGKPLSEIRKIYVQDSDDDITKGLRARLATGTIVSTTPDQADAALKVQVRKTSGDSRVIVTVRVVSENGYVVWPDKRRSSSWRYIGNSKFVMDRIVKDLTKAIEQAQERK